MAKDGIVVDPSKVKAVMDWHAPTSVTEIRSFLGIGRLLPEVHSGLIKDCYPIDPIDKEGSAVYLEHSVPGGI